MIIRCRLVQHLFWYWTRERQVLYESFPESSGDWLLIRSSLTSRVHASGYMRRSCTWHGRWNFMKFLKSIYHVFQNNDADGTLYRISLHTISKCKKTVIIITRIIWPCTQRLTPFLIDWRVNLVYWRASTQLNVVCVLARCVTNAGKRWGFLSNTGALWVCRCGRHVRRHCLPWKI